MLKLSPWKVAFLFCATCLTTALVASAQVTFTTLYSFCSQTNCTDGAQPYAALAQATNGDLYGTTPYSNDAGTVFKITPTGRLTTLHSFDGGTGGGNPYAGLVQATNGEFYGTTTLGAGAGQVFKITAGGTLTTLYTFCLESGCLDGANPEAALVQATNGSLYGTTVCGGANGGSGAPSCGNPGGGTVFEITLGGTLATLYSFCLQSGCADGANPIGALVQATNGSFYGTTAYGGASNSCQFGCGTVFRITPTGTLTTLHSFDFTDGANPNAALVPAAGGNFYGTTSSGGANGGGTVFKITPSGTLTTLHSFCSKSGCADGELPQAALVQATDGNFYGTTFYGGANGDGTVFRITPSGTLMTLHSFCSESGCTDGELPQAALLQATNGSFYGTTEDGGANGIYYGTVFSLSVGLEPFVQTNPTSGKVGTKVIILGNDLTGSTSVTFNGTAASFTTSKSGTYISTRVPSGATTGYVKVTTPSGTLTSNVKFRVAP